MLRKAATLQDDEAPIELGDDGADPMVAAGAALLGLWGREVATPAKDGGPPSPAAAGTPA